jgi:propionyl-CoA carboxylase alpha chain
MGAALDAYYIRGTGHNMVFLASVMAHPRFAEGRLSTDFIADEYPDGYIPAHPQGELKDKFVAVGAFVHTRIAGRARQIGQSGIPAEPAGVAPLTVRIGGDATDIEVRFNGGAATIRFDSREIGISADWRIGDPLLTAVISGETATFQIDRVGTSYRLTHGGAEALVRVLTRRAAVLNGLMPEKTPPDLSKFLLSPMPGLLVSVAVEAGARVRAGEELAVVEAMKMENILHAAADGTVKEICAAPGDSLTVDQIILEFE